MPCGGFDARSSPGASPLPCGRNGSGRAASIITTLARAGESESGRSRSRRRSRLDRNIALARQPRVDAEQIVFALERHGVAGEVDEGERVGAAGVDLGEEIAEHPQHVRLAQVGAFDDLEADAAQRFGDQPGVVERGRQRARTVGGVADHERDARLGLLGQGRPTRPATAQGSARRARASKSGETWNIPLESAIGAADHTRRRIK